MSDPSEEMRRFAGLLAAELRLARAGKPLGTPGELARELAPGYLLFKDRFGASEEATAVLRAEIASALGGGDEADRAVAAALGELGGGRQRGAPERPLLRRRRLWTELVAGCVLLGFGLFIGFITSRATLSCQRPPSSPGSCATASCRLQWHVLFGAVPIRDTIIDCLERAEQVREEARGERGTNVYYRVMLGARGRAEPYAMNASGEREPTLAVATEIRGFLAARDRPALRAVLAPAGFAAWMAVLGDVLLVLGIVTVLSVPFQIARFWLAGT